MVGFPAHILKVKFLLISSPFYFITKIGFLVFTDAKYSYKNCASYANKRLLSLFYNKIN